MQTFTLIVVVGNEIEFFFKIDNLKKYLPPTTMKIAKFKMI
jgi:hypothetical protein